MGTVAIIDCDVHQGDGTASILDGDASIFTFSMHGARNYPSARPARISTSNSGMQPATQAIWPILERAGRVFAHCPRTRDLPCGRRIRSSTTASDASRSAATDYWRVTAWCSKPVAGISVLIAIAMAGGYARNIADTVAIHAATILLASERLA